MNTIEIGQVYEDMDPRMGGRRLRVLWVQHKSSPSGGAVQVENLKTGRKTYINTRRLHPRHGKRAYLLVETPL